MLGDISLLGLDAEVSNATGVSDLIEEAGFTVRAGCFSFGHGAHEALPASKT